MSKKHYLCGIAFQHELGETDEIGIYNSLGEMKAHHKCWESCGVVEIESDGRPEDYTAFEWAIPQNLRWGSAGIVPDDYVDPEKKDGQE